MTHPSQPHAIIIGGGVSGVLLSYHLLRGPHSACRVTLIEQRPEVGRGTAYHTANPAHLLNVRASNMSALPDQPDHFWQWLSARVADGSLGERGALCPDAYCFAPRRLYGDYIESLIAPLRPRDGAPGRLSIVQAACVGVSERPEGAVVKLANGTTLLGDFAVLATGNDTSSASSRIHVDPWATPSSAGLPADAAVLILGTGLTMADYVLSLLLEGHTGPIVAISRRGLLPQAHRQVAPSPTPATEVPFGASFLRLWCWFRARITAHVDGGGDWRSVVDGVRPHTQRIWRELPLASKRQFLAHARAWWDVHRHRTAPQVADSMSDAIAAGRLTVMAAKLLRVEENPDGALVQYRRRGQQQAERLQVARIVDCTGIVRNPMESSNSAVTGLFAQGLARVDPLGIGLEVKPDGAIVDQYGRASRRLFAVGPLTRAAFWEIVAVPDIRNQCASLARHLLDCAAGDPRDLASNISRRDARA